MKKSFVRMIMIALIAVLILGVSLSSLSAAPKYTWKLASVLPAAHPVTKALVQFAERVNTLTKGDIKINVFTDGQLGQEADYLQGCSIGSIEISKVSAAPFAQYVPQMDALSIPFIWRNDEHQHHAVDGKVGQMLNAYAEAKGFKMLSYMDAGFRSFTMRDKPIKTPADLKGMKVRTQQSQLMLDVVGAFGATAVPMGQGDVYSALQTKVIDGWENNEPTVLSGNMYEVCKYFSYDRHSSIPDVVVMNLRVFNSLSKADQKAVLQASKEATIAQRKIWAAYMDSVVSELKAKGEIFNEVNNIKAFQATVKPAVDKFVAQSKVSGDLRKLINAINATK